MHNYWVGTSGFSYDDWKGIFYPTGLPQEKRLTYYAQHYNTVEINATFYRMFARSVFARWRDDTPDGFRFTLKGPRSVTHVKRLDDVGDELRQFYKSIQDLQDKLALVLWQLPPSFKFDSIDKLTRFVGLLPPDTKHVIELRHTSLFNDEVYTLLNEHRVGFVINDSAHFPSVEVITSDVCYIRFHGPAKLYASLYSIEAMQSWADKIRVWLNHYDVYAYFNNDYDGRALQNSIELLVLLSSQRHMDTANALPVSQKAT